MGTLNALGYTLAHPEHVAAVAATVPALNLLDLRDNRGAGAGIDAAYPPVYDDVVHGPTHSPIRYADQLDPDIPISLWTSSNDPLCLPEFADAFVTARPATARVDLGPVGHGDTSLTAAAAPIADWLR